MFALVSLVLNLKIISFYKLWSVMTVDMETIDSGSGSVVMTPQ